MLIVRTNNVWRNTVSSEEVPAKALCEFDWLSKESKQDGFFKYLGDWYHLSQFLRLNYPAPAREEEEPPGYHNSRHTLG